LNRGPEHTLYRFAGAGGINEEKNSSSVYSPRIQVKGRVQEESLVLLEKTVEDEAIRLAKILAEETGRCVTVRDGEFILIKTIPAAKLH
jgi:hypothetical protein